MLDTLLTDETNFTTHNLISHGQGQTRGSGTEGQVLRALNGGHGNNHHHDGHHVLRNGNGSSGLHSSSDQHQFSSSFTGDNNNRGGGRSISNGRPSSSSGQGQDRQGLGAEAHQQQVISLADVNWPKPERRPRFDSVGSAGSW